MKRLCDKLRMYEKAYEESPFSREIEGTVELLREAADKLTQYEELGTVEDFKKAIQNVKTLSGMWEKLNNKEVAEYHELMRYKDLEEQGKLLKLFCVRGDTVWFIKSAFSFAVFPIEAKVVSVNGVNFDNDVMYSASVKDSGIDRRFKNSDIGKTVFLTKESAEAALKEMSK